MDLYLVGVIVRLVDSMTPTHALAELTDNIQTEPKVLGLVNPQLIDIVAYAQVVEG
ncbi:hypothetical protein [Marinobacterium jannaschii]|uniref:hypothetical protein n=1 Tax=Marinobacterium jannaschii TaxID=64970 RepID=UPI000B25E5E7|nr:hypothetical protein [Marinobacterium jannaschii]